MIPATKLFLGVTLLILATTASGCGSPSVSEAGLTQSGVPIFEYDPSWPQQPINTDWTFGEVGGITVDTQGKIWVIQRPWTVFGRELGAARGQSACCRAAPPVIVFDASGAVERAWPELHEFHAPAGTSAGQGLEIGGSGETLWEAVPDPEGYGDWGRREHTVYVDHNDFVWIINDDSHVIYKMTHYGQYIMSLGEDGMTGGSNHTTYLSTPAALAVDPTTNEVFVADGYGNKRVIVFDAETGEYRRHWGAYGNIPEDWNPGPYDPSAPPSPQFRGPVHGIALSHDGLVYVADRSANRIQIFRQDGEFVSEAFVAPETRDLGTAFGVQLSHDPDQQWVYVNDGSNNKVWILRRADMEVVGSFGSAGRLGGQFLSPHSLAVGPDGSIYVGETRGRRVQKFAFRGLSD